MAGTTQHSCTHRRRRQRARPAPAAAAPTPRGLDRLWTVGRKSIRRDSYSSGGSPITSHSSPLAPLLRASNFAGAAASPRSMVRCSSPAIMMRVIISMYEKRQSEFPCTVESGELPWRRGDVPGRVDTHARACTNCTAGESDGQSSQRHRFIHQGQTKDILLDQSNKERNHSCHQSIPIDLKIDCRFLILQPQSSASCSISS